MSASAAPAAVPATPAVATAAPAETSVPVTGTLEDGTAFTGEISDLSASVVDGAVTVAGTITGTGLPTEGAAFAAPVEDLAATAGCSILDLDLGPLNLDLLGLVIDLAPVELDITAVPGAGNLLGNLLCALVGLFDGQGVLSGIIAALLDRLFSALGL
ncbi:ABC transporter substrate-binding protein [Phycicoccus sp. CSK15P-2]|nr:ABC transporter substrate-binding protein [Phycicoccus sp. CSK15P-2]